MATKMKVRSIPEDSYYSKVVINGETIMDLTADTVDAAHILTGYTAHNNSQFRWDNRVIGPSLISSKSLMLLAKLNLKRKGGIYARIYRKTF